MNQVIYIEPKYVWQTRHDKYVFKIKLKTGSSIAKLLHSHKTCKWRSHPNICWPTFRYLSIKIDGFHLWHLPRITLISYHNHFIPLPFRTICRSIHYYHFVPYADQHIMTISYHMQINTLLPYAKSYADSTFILILHHIQINVIPKYMLHVGTVKRMYLRQEKKRKKNIYMYIMLLCNIIYSEP